MSRSSLSMPVGTILTPQSGTRRSAAPADWSSRDGGQPKGRAVSSSCFSAGFGQTAADRLNDNDREPTSVYTRTLLNKISVEGKPITDLAREVREDVEALAATVNHEQRPAYYDELSGPCSTSRRRAAVGDGPRSPQQIVSRPVEPSAQPLVTSPQQQRPDCSRRCRRCHHHSRASIARRRGTR